MGLRLDAHSIEYKSEAVIVLSLNLTAASIADIMY